MRRSALDGDFPFVSDRFMGHRCDSVATALRQRFMKSRLKVTRHSNQRQRPQKTPWQGQDLDLAVFHNFHNVAPMYCVQDKKMIKVMDFMILICFEYFQFVLINFDNMLYQLLSCISARRKFDWNLWLTSARCAPQFSAQRIALKAQPGCDLLVEFLGAK